MISGEGRQRAEWAVYVAVVLLTGMFFAVFLNRFAGLRSGNGEFSGGVAWLSGQMPYRDYYTAGPPLNGMKSALLLWAFGKHLLVSRVAGAVERMVLAAVLLRWLRQVVGLRAAAIGALVAVVLSAGDRTDPVASYNHDAILWAMLAGFCASVALGRRRRGAVLALGAAVGVCASLSLLTKQTVGAGAVLVVLFVPAACLWRRGWGAAGWVRAAEWTGAVLAGIVPPLAMVGGVLWHFGLLRRALLMMFVRGPAAKAGHPGDFFVRMGLVAWDNVGWIALGVFWLLLAWGAMVRATRGRTDETPVSRAWVMRFGATGVAVLLVGELLRRWPALHDSTKAVVYATEFGLVLLSVVAVRRWGRGGGDAQDRLRDERMLLLVATGLAVVFFLALSWPAFEAMLLPGAGLLVALAVEGASGRWRGWTFAVLLLLCLMQVREKLDLPFGFDLQDEGAVRTATVVAGLPMLEGMRLPEATVRLLRGTSEAIAAHTGPGETVLTFPEMDLIYTMSGRQPPTVAHSHNMDVVNDAMAREEADRLRRSPPVVLVYYRETEADLKGAERLWRRGGRSGQREMIAAIEELLPRYRRQGEYVLREGDPPVGVYVLAGH